MFSWLCGDAGYQNTVSLYPAASHSVLALARMHEPDLPPLNTHLRTRCMSLMGAQGVTQQQSAFQMRRSPKSLLKRRLPSLLRCFPLGADWIYSVNSISVNIQSGGDLNFRECSILGFCSGACALTDFVIRHQSLTPSLTDLV